MDTNSGNARVLQNIDPDLFGGDSDDEFLSQIEMPEDVPQIETNTKDRKNISFSSQNQVIEAFLDKQCTELLPVESRTSSTGRKRQRSISPVNLSHEKSVEKLSSLFDSPLKSENFNVHIESKKGSFPGPAGLLPNVDRSVLKLVNSSSQLLRKISGILSSAKQETSEFNSDQESLDNSYFQSGPWKELLRSLNIDDLDEESTDPLKLMNIDWVKRKAIVMPYCRKIPLLVAVIKEAPDLICTSTKPKAQTLKLIDPTGWIYAAIDSNIVHCGVNLSPGTAIALQNVGLLRSKKRQPILTITYNNLVSTAFCQTSSEKLSLSPQDKLNEGQLNPINSPVKFTSLQVKKYLNSDSFISKSIQEFHKISEMKIDDSPSSITNIRNFSEQSDNQFIRPNKIFSEIQDEPLEDDPFGDDDNDEFLLAVKDLMDF